VSINQVRVRCIPKERPSVGFNTISHVSSIVHFWHPKKTKEINADLLLKCNSDEALIGAPTTTNRESILPNTRHTGEISQSGRTDAGADGERAGGLGFSVSGGWSPDKSFITITLKE